MPGASETNRPKPIVLAIISNRQVRDTSELEGVYES